MKFHILSLFLSLPIIFCQKDDCDDHNQKFKDLVSCLNENNYDYLVCDDKAQNFDWDLWVSNKCYFVLNLPRML